MRRSLNRKSLKSKNKKPEEQDIRSISKILLTKAGKEVTLLRNYN